MRSQLLDCILEHSCVDVVNFQVVSVVCLLEPHSFQDGQASVDLRNSRLHCIVVQVHISVFLICWVFMDVFNECGDGLEASLRHARRTDLRIQSLDGLDAVLDQLCRCLLSLGLFGGSLAAEALALIALKDLSHAGLLPRQLSLLSFARFDISGKLLLVSDSLRRGKLFVHAGTVALVFSSLGSFFFHALLSRGRLKFFDLRSFLFLAEASEHAWLLGTSVLGNDH